MKEVLWSLGDAQTKAVAVVDTRQRNTWKPTDEHRPEPEPPADSILSSALATTISHKLPSLQLLRLHNITISIILHTTSQETNMPPKIKIPVHVFVYTLAFIPGVTYAYYWYKNVPTDEEFEQTLRKNYSHNIQSSREKHGDMNKFLKGVIQNDEEQQERMAEVLRGGRGGQKRLHAVDLSLYGTEEGAKLQREAMMKKQQEQEEKKIGKKKGKKKKQSKGKLERDMNIEGGDTVDDGSDNNSKVMKQSVAAVLVAGTLAAGATLLLGGKRSQ